MVGRSDNGLGSRFASKAGGGCGSVEGLAQGATAGAIWRFGQRRTACDLFCGAEGLSLGLRMAGVDLVCAVDSNSSSAIQTYRQNLGDHAREQQIAVGIEQPNVDIIAGGPPCQGFSSVGMAGGDARITFVPLFARIVVRQRPLAFVFENVEGFLTSENGAYVLDLLCPLIEAWYCIHLRKVNAANFGVPQPRGAVIGIGGLGWNPTFPDQPTPLLARLALVWRERPPRTPTISDALAGLPGPKNAWSRRANRQGTITGSVCQAHSLHP